MSKPSRPATPSTPRVIVVMGVSGVGKTTVGSALAASLGWRFDDADAFHPPANVEKMRHGIPLDDADRAPWLAAMRDHLAAHLRASSPVVLACSALRQSYRDALVPAAAPAGVIRFVHLEAPPEVLRERLATRSGHFMPASLLASQLATLEPPSDAPRIDAAQPLPGVVADIRRALGV